MSGLTLISFIIYCVVTSITPGPNNIMVATSGLNFGLKRSMPHIWGIGFGFSVMVMLVGLGIGTLLSSSPLLFEILKLIGIAYLLYLAYQIFHMGHMDTSVHIAKPMSFIAAALFQWVNPKAWIMAMGAITTYAANHNSWIQMIFLGLVFGLVSLPCVGVWAYLGERMQALVNEPKKIKYFNMAMAFLLVLSVLVPLYESYQFFTRTI